MNYYADVTFAAGSTGKFFFVDIENEHWESHKSVGPDGEEGTLDDGLPSTIYEFIVLCERMVNDGVQPVQMAGQYPQYANPMLDGLMVSLMGPEKYAATNSLTGEVEVVTGFTNENLVGNIDYIKKPITKTIEISEESGYYMTWQVEKYYAQALLEILDKQSGFFADGSRSVGAVSHLGAQENLIFSGYNKLGSTAKEVAMLSDSSHLYFESKDLPIIA